MSLASRWHSVQPRNLLSVKGYGLLSFGKNMPKDTGKNISENLGGKYSQKRLDHAKQSATDALKYSSKRLIRKTAEATDDLIGNKITVRITKVSKNSLQNNSQTVTYENDKEILKEKYISPKERIRTIGNLTLI